MVRRKRKPVRGGDGIYGPRRCRRWGRPTEGSIPGGVSASRARARHAWSGSQRGKRNGVEEEGGNSLKVSLICLLVGRGGKGVGRCFLFDAWAGQIIWWQCTPIPRGI